jgi:hypothetical protein
MDGKTKTEKKIGYLHLVKKKLLTTCPPVQLVQLVQLVQPVQPVQLVRLSACPPVRYLIKTFSEVITSSPTTLTT